jgi:hypothetical protein
MSHALVAAPQNAALSLLMDPVRFDHLQRVGKMLALSPLFPEHLRKGGLEQSIANAVLVLNMANRLNEDPLTVGQNIYFVGGKPGWSTSYMIGKVRQHGVFRDPIDWEYSGSADSLSVTAFAVLSSTGRKVSFTCDMAMAKAEGWTKNPKYQSMPKVMLSYRSAAFLIRLYCPDVMIGVPMAVENELVSMRDVSPDDAPQVVANTEPPIEAKPATPAAEAKPADAEPPKKTRHEIQKEYEAEQRKAAEAQRAKKPAGPTEAQMRGMLDLIRAEVAQGATLETINDTYGAQMIVMQVQFPAVFADLQAVLPPPAPAEQGEPAGDLFKGAQDEAPDFLSSPVARQFLADVDTVGLDEARSLHESSLDGLRRTSPEAYRALIRRAEDIEASA